MTVERAVVAERVAAVQARIAAAGSGARLVAVTKGFDRSAVDAALGAGIADVGESYADELLAKALPESGADDAHIGPRWHFIGRLQRNKVRRVASVVHLWHSVDREPLVDEIARRAPGAAVLVQVDTTGEPTKGGCRIADTDALVGAAASAGLDVRGLMTIGPTDAPAVDIAASFARLARLGESLGLAELSMGMSGDWEIALDEGATIIRLGTTLFGPRPQR